MDENIQTIRNVATVLDNICIPGRITVNAPIYNQIIACVNSLNQVAETLEKPEDDHEEDTTE